MSYYQRNQASLQDYQREYARRKRAPGRRKVSKAERQLLEEQYVKKQLLMGTEVPSTAHSKVYECALIVRSRAVDPLRTAEMAEKEENARQYFEELKLVLPEISPHLWKEEFKKYVDKFIQERLYEEEFVTMVPWLNEKERQQERTNVHELRRLVAGAVQEWELVQQSEHAATCAKIDRALVWQGRGVNLRKFRKLYGW